MALNLIAIITPKGGKTDRVIERLREMAEYVKSNEPGTLQYEIMRVNKDRKTGKEEVVMVEKYVFTYLTFIEFPVLSHILRIECLKRRDFGGGGWASGFWGSGAWL